MDFPEYTGHVGTKFNSSGEPLSYPGFSYVSMVPVSTRQHKLFKWASTQFKIFEKNVFMALLPPHSFHMTLIDLLCDKLRKKEFWSGKIDMNLPFPGVEMKIKEMLSGLEIEQGFQMDFNGIDNETGVFCYKPHDTVTKQLIIDYRKRISDTTDVYYPNFSTYKTHTTLFYFLKHFPPDERRKYEHLKNKTEKHFLKHFGTIYIPPPKLTFFKDMHDFKI